MVFPYQCNQSAPKGEQYVYNLLKAEYGDSEQTSVFHEVRIQKTRERNREFEIDFIVATSKYIICIEVKGGNVQFDAENNRWTQNGHILSSPVEQAIDNKHAFVSRFRSDLSEIQVYWAVCFPDVSVIGELPTQADDINVIDSVKLTYIDEYFRSVESAAYSARKSDPFPSRNANYALKRILGSLTRGFGFEPSIQSRLDSNATVFAELLDQQLEIVEGLVENNKLMIKGSAGTGKSLVGLHQLFRRYELNEKVLFLTFNRQLAKNFSYLVKRDFSIREGEELLITNFHQIARRIIEEFSPDWWESIGDKNEEFWDLEVPSKLDESLPTENYMYDFIVIDEAQDFVDIWLDPIMKLLSPKGKISILMDDKQDIFERATKFKRAGFTSFRLDKVIRSSRKNTLYVNEHLDLNLTSHKRVPEGSGVVDLRNESIMTEAFNSSLNDLGIKANQVTFIYNPGVGLKEFETFKNGRDRISKNRDPYARRGEIAAVSVALMKGLECDIAAIVGLESMTTAERYVALTRSKNLIYLL